MILGKSYIGLSEVPSQLIPEITNSKLDSTTQSKITKALPSDTISEPTGATAIPNVVWITQANYDAAVIATTIVETTLYIING